MTPAEQRVVAELNRTGGNVVEVARDLGTSKSYIHRIKREHWRPADETLDSSLVPANTASLSTLKAVMPPNVEAVIALRDKTVEVIQSQLEVGLVDLDSATKLLKVILQYERALDQQITPALNVFQDNRQNNIQINNLVDALQALSPDALRAFAGVPEPVVIDIEKTPA